MQNGLRAKAGVAAEKKRKLEKEAEAEEEEKRRRRRQGAGTMAEAEEALGKPEAPNTVLAAGISDAVFQKSLPSS